MTLSVFPACTPLWLRFHKQTAPGCCTRAAVLSKEMGVKTLSRSGRFIVLIGITVLSQFAFSQAPTITSISSGSGVAGMQVQIVGSGFGASQGTSTVALNGTSAVAASWSSTAIVAIVPSGASSGLFSVTVGGQTAHSSSFTVTALPSGWQDGDVGTVGDAGSASYANGVFSVTGAGSEIYGSSDSFNFAYQQLSGNGSIVARVVNLQSAEGWYAAAGVMIRETLNTGATNATVEDSPDPENFSFDVRTTTGGSAGEIGYVGDMKPPYWVQVVRSGNSFTGYVSSDGVNWTQLGSSQTISMATNVYVGLAVTSGSTSSLATGTFDNVSVNSSTNPAPVITDVSATTGSVGSQVTITGSGFGASQGSSQVTLNAGLTAINSWSNTSITATLPTTATSGPLVVTLAPSMDDSNPIVFTVTSQPLPSEWLDGDVGVVGTAGSATYASGVFTVEGAGSEIYSTADSFHFAYQQVSGNGSFVARVVSLQGAEGWYAGAGVMVRETLNTAATNATVEDSPDPENFSFDVRTTTGGSADEAGYLGDIEPPYWVKVVRSGNSFSGYVSTNGTSWTQLGSTQTISMATNFYVGLVVTSGSTSSLATGTFDNVSDTFAVQTPAPSITGLSPNAAVPETSVTISGANFGSTQGSSTVTFNGTTGTPTSWSATSIVMPVPLAATSGNVVVTVNGTASNGVPFTVSQTPTINSISPTSGPAGTAVTISGVNFGSTQGTSTVTFNGTGGTPTSWTSTSIVVPVPGGATTGNVVVTTTNGTSSGVSFTVFQVPSIANLSASSATIGSLLTITGTNFGSSQASSTVTLNGVGVVPTSWSSTSIALLVPVGATTGNVVVTVNTLASNAVPLTIVTLSLPSVSHILPANGATAIPENGRVIVRFAQPVPSAAVIPGTISVSQGATNVGGSLVLSSDRLSITFTPSQNLSASTTFNVAVTDLAGNQTTPEFQSTFATGSTTDTVNPTIVQTNPQSNSTGVPTSAPIIVQFSKVIDPTTVTPQSFSVTDNVTGLSVQGTLQEDPSGMTASFIPQAALGVGRTFAVSLSSTIEDSSGNSLTGSASSFTFTTAFAADSTAPQMVGMSPANGMTGVPLNAVIVLQFSKPLDGISVANGLQVETGGQPISGAIALSNSNQQVTFTPLGGLAPSATYTITTTSQITDVGGLALSNPGSFSLTTSSADDNTTPSVVGVGPTNSAAGVPTNGVVQLQFSKPVDPLTVNTATFQLLTYVTGSAVTQNGAVSVSASGLTATFVPSGNLNSFTTYWVEPTSGITDLEGHALTNFSASFTTGAANDSSSPTVQAVSPANNENGVPANVRVDVEVSTPLDPESVTGGAVVVSAGSTQVSGTVSLSSSGTILTFVPSNLLTASTTYTITVSGVTDQAGNSLASFTSSFATGTSGTANTTQPSVVSASPASGATGVSVTAPIVLTFNEPIDLTTVNDTTVPISVSGLSGALSGSYSLDTTGAVLTFTPLSPLPGNATIQVQVSSGGVLDLSGNGSTSYSGRFSTGTGTDTTAPTIVAVTPTNASTGISLNTPVVLTFSKSLNPTTINATNFGLLLNGVPSTGFGISISADNRVVTLNANGLPASSTVTVVVTSGVTDLYGNPLANFESQFTTGPAPSLTAPIVVSQRPGNGATGVPVNDTVVLYLSQPMNATSVTGALNVSQNGALVSGTTQVTDNGQVVQFTPSASLQPNVLVQVFLTPTAVSVAGLSVNNYQSSFTTVPNASTAVPIQVSSNPANSALNIPTNVVIDVGFNVPLDPTTLTAETVLCNQNGVWFQSDISLVNGGSVIQVVPRSQLQPNTFTICQVSTSLQGLNGVPSQGGGLGFTTGSGPDTTVPTIVTLSPPSGLTNVGDNANVRLVFSKPINPLTVNASTIQLSGNGITALPDSISFSNNNQMVFLVPHAPLPDNTQMTLTISGITDVAGNPVAPQTTQFTTGTGPDVVAPLVVWTNPLETNPYQAPTGVPVNAIVQIQVNEPVDPGTVNGTTFSVNDSATNQNVNGTYSISADGLTVTFVPSASLTANHQYSVYSLSGGMTDLAGNGLSNAVSPVMGNFSFTTGAAASTNAPQVTGVSPASGATGIPINARVVVGFNEPVDATKLSGLTLSGPSGAVNASQSISNGNQTVALIPAVPLAASTQYTVNIAGVQDFSGNVLSAPVTSSFTTGSSADLTLPNIASSSPSNSATGASTTAAVQVQFSKPIDPLTVLPTTFYLYPYSTNIPAVGTISVSANGLTATFTPSEPLDSLTLYEVRLTGGITDMEGQSLNGSGAFSFTTGQGTTTLAPVIDAITPPGAAVGSTVDINGSYFGTSQGTSTVTFNGVPAAATSWSDAQIVVPVPSGATTGPVVVTVNGVTSNSMMFTVKVTPAITSVSPPSATVGTVLTIAGSNFGDSQDATTVTFSSSVYPFYQAVTPISWTETSMTVAVPATAATGNVFVQVGANASNALSFTVIPTPNVSSLSSNSGVSGTAVGVYGTNFGSSQGSSTVSFNGVAASVTGWTNTSIAAVAPSNVTTGPVTVVVNSIPSNSNVVFTVTSPAIGSLLPPAGAVGATVTLTGSGLTASGLNTQVFFNGVAANVTSSNSGSLTVQVPSNATSGPVTVEVGTISTNSLQFTVEQPPTIASVSPNVGPYNSYGVAVPITITGTGFGATQSDSTVNFFASSTPPQITNWSDTSITLYVPDDAATGPLGMQVGGLTGYAPTWFVVSGFTQVTDSFGNQTTYSFSMQGGQWIASSSEGPGCVTCSMRGNILNLGDSNGNIISTTDDLNNTTTFTYDGSNDMTSASKPLNSNTTATTSYTYNNFGEVLTLTDPLGNVTTNTYDPNGNLLTVTSPAPNSNTPASVTQFQYATNGELTQITDPKGNPTTLTYNSVGLIATITDAQNNTTSYQYDPRGNRTVVIDPINGSSHPTTFTYDIMSRLTGITYPDGSTVGFTYDIRGRRVTATDQNNKTTTYAYDDADRLISVTDPATNVTQYAYDTEDNLLSITDANNHVTQFAYNARGWVTQTTFPSTLAESYTYDLVGNLQSKTDRKNQTIQYVYDALYRLTSKTYPDQTSVEYAYDLAGKVQQVSDPTGTYGFSYDNMGRLIGTSTQYSYLPGVNFQNAYAYDAASNRTSLTAPDGSTTSYGYDTLNRLNSLANSWAGSFGFGYDALSRRTQLTRPNGVTTNYGYDSVSHLLSVLHQAGNTTLDGASYTYDPAGNRTAKTNYLNSVTSNYSYDPLYELTQVTQGSSTTETYSYDAVGNRLSSSGVPTYSYNTSNELTSNSNGSYTYDANGNTLTDAAARTFTWDFENRLTQAVVPGTNGGTTTFKYDPFGRRIQKSGPLGTTNYLYDGDNSLEEVDQNGNVLARYTQGLGVDEQLAQLRSGATSYYQADGLASITSLSNSAGTVAGTYAYDSFGNLTASTGTVANPFRYTGREFDSETGIYANRARYYDEAEGRFLSEDPIRFFGGEDFYSYVANSAPNFSDAFGLCKELEREACRRAAYSRYIGAYRRNKAESDKQANHIGIDWATESWMTYGAEKFFSGPVVIETGWVWVGKVTHKIVPVIEIYHAAHTVEEEAEVVVESYRKWRDAEMELKRDLALCDSL